jgi:hypothetical protein
MPTLQRPFDQWRVQQFDPHYGYAWYCGEGLIVSHVTVTHCTVASARAYHAFEGAVLRDRAAEIARAGGLFVIHDWRTMGSYEREGRQFWQARMRERPKGYLKGSLVCVAKANKLLRMAVEGANLIASLTHGGKVELTTDIDEALRRYHVGPERSFDR